MHLKMGWSVALVKWGYLCSRIFFNSAHNSGDELKVGAQRHAANWGYLAICTFRQNAARDPGGRRGIQSAINFGQGTI